MDNVDEYRWMTDREHEELARELRWRRHRPERVRLALKGLNLLAQLLDLLYQWRLYGTR